LVKGIDVVFHLAALIPIPYSYRAPDSYIETNIRGTLNVCHASLSRGVEKIIHTSTSEVYGTAEYLPMDERHPLHAQSPYSASKIGADAIAISFKCSFGLPVVIARPFNTYGPRQSARAVIPTIISQIAAGARRIKLGNLASKRDFTYVGDTCRGLIAIAALEAGEVFHIGSNVEVSVGDLFELVADLMESDAQIEVDSERQRPLESEVFRLCCNPKKLRDASGFHPEIGLREGLNRTIEWFRDPGNLRRYKGSLYNV
jgi:nucleoside-diphosphate-sugar epimerase